MSNEGTEAKRIALYFLRKTGVKRTTPAIMKKTISQAKSLLNSGYNTKEITDVINYVIDVKNINMYSLGYVNTCINDVLKLIERDTAEESYANIQKEQVQYMREQEVSNAQGSTERNRTKASRFGVQRRFGEEHSFYLHERA